MFQWCSYCQRFLSEKPPFEDHSITHGICIPCVKIVKTMTLKDEDRSQLLVEFQKKLNELGKSNNVTDAIKLIDKAISNGIREVDILFGFLTPLLEKKTNITFSDSIQNTDSISTFSFLLIEKIRSRISVNNKNHTYDVLFVSQEQNQHILGIQLLELWLNTESISTLSTFGNDIEIMDQVNLTKPKVFGISISDPTDILPARRLINKIKASTFPAPLFLVGGLAVKLGKIQREDIPEATLIDDTSRLILLIKNHLSLSFLYDLKYKDK